MSFVEDIEMGGSSVGQSKSEVPSVGAKACAGMEDGVVGGVPQV